MISGVSPKIIRFWGFSRHVQLAFLHIIGNALLPLKQKKYTKEGGSETGSTYVSHLGTYVHMPMVL